MHNPKRHCRIVVSDKAPNRPPNSMLIDGRQYPIAQDHLLEPFRVLLDSLESLAAAACPRRPDEERPVVQDLYRALYAFFAALLPSAGHSAVDGLAYSTSLLLIGEAIQANRIVRPAPRSAPAAATPPPTRTGGKRS